MPIVMYQYQFTSTIEDLLDAEKVERSASIQTSMRWIVVIMGLAWIVVGVIAFDLNKPIWRPLIWIFIGIAILYLFIIRPYFKRNRIKRNNASHQDLMVEFLDDCIKLHITGVGDFTRQWEEFAGFIDADKGILFYFNDGIVNWLPNRVFTNIGARNGLVEFLRGKQEAS